MSSERRRHTRVEAELPCRLVHGDGQEEAFDLIDLSESGARINCARQLDSMTRIRVAMVLPGARLGHDEDLRVETVGVVVWSHPVADDRFDTGVFFAELDEDQRELLQSFVQATTA